MEMLDIIAEKCFEDLPPYSRHDWIQVRRLWSEPGYWSLRRQLKERVCIFKEIFISHGWPPSKEALRARRKLTKAHFQILCLRRKIRKGKVITEDREQMERDRYGLYAEALNELQKYTGYRFLVPEFMEHGVEDGDQKAPCAVFLS